MRNEILKLILTVAAEQNSILPQAVAIEKGADCGLYGAQGVMDSLALVRFIVEIEAAVEERFGVSIVLANERAMSQQQSPFLTAGSLATYIEQVLKEAGAVFDR